MTSFSSETDITAETEEYIAAHESYHEFMSILEQNSNKSQKKSHQSGQHSYLITQNDYPIFSALLTDYLEAGGTPQLDIIIPPRGKFHLFHQLNNILDSNIRDVIRQLEHHIITSLKLKNQSQLKYSLDALENNYHQFRVFWYYQGKPLRITKTVGETLIRKFKKEFPSSGKHLSSKYVSTPLIGTYLTVETEKNLTDRYLPICLNRVSDKEIHDYSILGY